MENDISHSQTIFDEFLSKCNRGSRLNPSDIIDPSFPNDFLSRARSQIEHYSKTYNDSSKYHIDLTISGKMEAFSFLNKDIGFIAVSFDTILILRILFLRILSDPNSFPGVGNVHLEEPLTSPYLTGLPKSTNELNVESRSPKCVMREGFSRILTITSFHFLVAHELAHLSNGHLAWINSLHEGSLISEVTGNNTKPLSAITRQTLEMDADASAVKQVITAIYKSPEVQTALTKGMNKESLHVHNAAYGTPEKTIYLLLYVTTIFFKIFDESYWNEHSLSVRSHPPSPFRNIWVGSTLQELIKRDISTDLAEKVTEIGAEAYKDAVLALGRLTDEKPNIDGLLGAISDKFAYYPSSLLKHWGKIRPHLEPFSTGAGLAPVQL